MTNESNPNEIERKFYVVQPANLPRKYPLWPTLVVILVADRFHAPNWVWGITLCALVAWWFDTAARKTFEVPVEVFRPLSEEEEKEAKMEYR